MSSLLNFLFLPALPSLLCRQLNGQGVTLDFVPKRQQIRQNQIKRDKSFRSSNSGAAPSSRP